jgi:uncharacterized protein (TIGR02231 family)
MKNSLLTVFLFLAGTLYAATEKQIKSSIKNVTVFTQSAQVFRTAVITLNPGVTDLLFSGISPSINASSIQASGKGNFIVLDVKHTIKYPEPSQPTPGTFSKETLREIKTIEDSLTELAFLRDEWTDKKSALELEKNMIQKNKLTQGEGKSDSLPMLKQAMEFFRIKLNDINMQLGKIKRDEKKNQDITAQLKERLTNLKAYKNSEEPPKKYEPVHQIVVTVSADESTTGSIEINYMVTQAGWTPSYDLRSNAITEPVQLTYKANIFQSSGEDWNNIKLKLSTGNPNRSNIKPALPSWYINYFTAPPIVKYSMSAREKSGANATTNESYADMKKDVDALSPAQSAANYSQMIETMTNMEFEIKLSYTIPSDGANHAVSIKNSELPAQYYHFMVPKMDSEAFLIAKVTGWESLNLLPGKANIFYDGTYLGETVLNPSVINDTIELALGRDNGITVTRTKLPVKENNKLLGNEITKTIAYELRFKNNKTKAINLMIEDQIPITQNKDIKIELKEKSKADYNEQTGLLTWNTTVETKGYKTFLFSYTVTYNKDKPLSLN